MEYIYPAIFHLNSDSSYTITFPDLEGCVSEGKSLGNAISMAQSALIQWIEYLKDKKIEIPTATPVSDVSNTITNPDAFVNLVRIEIKDKYAVKRTVSIPKWMDDKVFEAGLSLSRVLQEALTDRLAQ